MPGRLSVLYVGAPDAAKKAEEAIHGVSDSYTFETARSSDAALERLDRTAVDAVIAEADLRDGDGLELLVSLLEIDETLPTVLIDETASRERLQRALETGVTDYVGVEPDTGTFEALAERLQLAVAGRRDRFHDHQRYNEQILDAFPDMVFVVDADGRVLDWNARVPEVMGQTDAQLEAMEADGLLAEASREEILGAIEMAFEGERDRFEALVRTSSGESAPYEFVAAPTRDPEGRRVLVAVGRDITEAKEREKHLRRQRDQLEILNRLVRHDIRNDMTVVVGLAELLREQVPEEHREDLVRIYETGKHAMELTKVARALVEIINEGGTLEREPQPLARFLRTEFENARRSFPEARFRLEGSIPDVDVQANELLGAVFRNILNNAVQHNDEESPEVVVGANRLDGRVRVEIADNGPGIPDGQKAQLFERTGEPLSTEETSIGLSLVRRLIEIYGGEIEVADNDPEGTVVAVTLQLVD